MRTKTLKLAVCLAVAACFPVAAVAGLTAAVTSPTTTYNFGGTVYPIVASGGVMTIQVSAGGDSFYGLNCKRSSAHTTQFTTWTQGINGTWNDSFSVPSNGTQNILMSETATYTKILDMMGTTGGSVEVEYLIDYVH